MWVCGCAGFLLGNYLFCLRCSAGYCFCGRTVFVWVLPLIVLDLVFVIVLVRLWGVLYFCTMCLVLTLVLGFICLLVAFMGGVGLAGGA